MSPFVVFLCTDKSGSIQLCLSVNGEFNPNAARLITAAHDAYFWVDDGNMPHWTVDAEEGGCYGYGEICQQV